ncbi:MAG TPA: riboflavin synthase [Candidatus Avidesulfovibrio excrementigallinarum]|nr:riboflavin synthase [Candidatus Avidesulfovibrio excrementigallinarum]
MFTGLVQGQGDILAVERRGQQRRFLLRTRFPIPDMAIGESIAVNGACLTVETGQVLGSCAEFQAYASGETVSRTTLGELAPGCRVNLERALALGDRLGGHIVSGHVDGVAVVRSVEARGDSRRIVLAFPEALAPEVIEKGSVALDGISLTVNACTDTTLEVNVIPETWRVTTVGTWKTGSRVNMETDVLGKYVRRQLRFLNGTEQAPPSRRGVDFALLRENGFL